MHEQGCITQSDVLTQDALNQRWHNENKLLSAVYVGFYRLSASVRLIFFVYLKLSRTGGIIGFC